MPKLPIVGPPAPRAKHKARATRAKFEVTALFGSNPGRLVMKSFAPAKLPKHPPLVLILHGCRQTPKALDAASGFSRLARARGFVLLYPAQTKDNNPQNCFNWFRPSAVTHDRGELLSITQMIEHACKRHHLERSRIFIVGLSAGAAMAATLVANYPEIFAGAASVAGMPVGSARDAISAFRAMSAGAGTAAAGWGNCVTELSAGGRSFPRISVRFAGQGR